MEERKRTLDNSRMELKGIETRLEKLNKDFKACEKKVQEAVRRVCLNQTYGVLCSLLDTVLYLL